MTNAYQPEFEPAKEVYQEAEIEFDRAKIIESEGACLRAFELPFNPFAGLTDAEPYSGLGGALEFRAPLTPDEAERIMATGVSNGLLLTLGCMEQVRYEYRRSADKRNDAMAASILLCAYIRLRRERPRTRPEHVLQLMLATDNLT